MYASRQFFDLNGMSSNREDRESFGLSGGDRGRPSQCRVLPLFVRHLEHHVCHETTEGLVLDELFVDLGIVFQ